MADTEMTLYERIGGADAVADMVDAFYIRVLADPELRPFFDGVALEQLRTMQREFFSAALDGPVSSSDRDLAEVHHGMSITRRHVTHFVRHLISVLDSRELISRSDAMEIIFRIATYADEVCGHTGGTDG
jgi:hemoglobin